VQQDLFGWVDLSGGNFQQVIGFNSDNTLEFQMYNSIAGGYVNRKTTSQVFRDPSAWYHIVVVWDSNNATVNDRAIIYINGSRVTAWANNTNPSLNQDSYINNSSYPLGIARCMPSSSNYFDGYLTEINFVNAQALTPSSFGETSATTGVWIPKKFVGTYGTNGFYLKFTDTTSTSTLGTDFSGNSNTWTVNNISLTAGTTYDSMTDVPTLTSATTANYCVLNPLQLATPVLSYSLSNGNLQLNSNSGSTYNCFANGTIFPTTGKWYAEFQQTGGTRVFAGISRFTDIAAPNSWNSSSTYYINTGEIQKDGSTVVTGATWTTGDIIGVAYDADAATCAFYKNNVLQTTVTGVTAGTYSFSVNGYQSGVIVANFGQQPWVYTAPSGFVRLNTFNLSTPTIGTTASTTANKYFNAVLYTGNSPSSQTVQTGFYPDLVWQKSRTQAYSNVLYDSVRGVQKRLSSNETAAESTASTAVTAFASTSFTTGADGEMNDPTGGSNNHVAWVWNANSGSTVSNTAGSITSTVSANTTAGFSIVTYTGTGANATVGHGLGVAPQFIITKTVSTALGNWGVYHASLGATKALNLNNTIAAATFIQFWNNTAPTSTVFSVGTSNDVNGVSTYVAYCWAEIAGFSKFGSYTGNGSSDGTFVYTGFRPRFVMIKNSSASSTNWFLYDTQRSAFNVTDDLLLANASASEYSNDSNYAIDILSNGFKIRNTDSQFNGSGNTLIYMAFAESPFKYANAR
jgi:hypothetical protein